MKKPLCFILALLMSAAGMCMPLTVGAADGITEKQFTVNGENRPANAGEITVFSGVKEISSDEFNFYSDNFMVFDKDGKAVEAGANLIYDPDKRKSVPQRSVRVPDGGFCVFYSGNPGNISSFWNSAVGNAMFYNSSIATAADIKAEYDAKAKTLKITEKPEKKIPGENITYLFIGNSATYYSGTPRVFRDLCRKAGLNVDVDYCTYGASNLMQFADESHEYGRNFRSRIKSRKYDYIVFQDAGGASEANTLAALEVLVPLAKESGAKPLLYMRYSDQTRSDAFYNRTAEHYVCYTKAAEKFDAVAAPSAVAYYLCRKEHPEYNLYADDLNHHSKLGAYLIACTWLKSFAGVDPNGNASRLGVNDDEAKVLQEIANRACENPEQFPLPGNEPPKYKGEDGKEYDLITYKKPYTSDGGVYEGKWTDAKPDGKPMGKLTDGIICTDGENGNVGCWKNSTVKIKIDLEGYFEIKAFKADLFGKQSWGIPDPANAKVNILVSTDGKKFELLGEAKPGEKTDEGFERIEFTLVPDKKVCAKAVIFEYNIDGNFCWTSECAAFGLKADEEKPEESKPEESKAEEPKPAESKPAESKPEESAEKQSEDKKINGGLIALIVGAVVGAAVVAAVGVKRKKNKDSKNK